MTKNQEEHTEQSQRRMWPWLVLLGLVLLLLTLRLSLRTDFVRGIVKNQVISVANEQLNVRLDIEQLSGDLWKEVNLQGISLTSSDSDTVASIENLDIRYNILSYFQPVFEIPDVRILKPFIKLRQQDSVINAANWVKSSPADTTTSEPFSFRVNKFSMNNGKVDALIDVLPKDSAFVVDNILLNSSFALLEDGYEADISDFSFDILQTRLNQAISFETQLRADRQTIDMGKLVIATGNSILQSSGRVNTQDTTTQLQLQALPLSWRDIAAYVDGFPVQQNLTLGLRIQGNLNQFHIGLDVATTGIENLKLGADLAWNSDITLKKAQLSADRINFSTFLGDTALPEIHDIQLEANGDIPLQEYERGSMEGTLTTADIQYLSYSLNALNTTFSLSNGKVEADLQAGKQNQKIQAAASINEIWEAKPGVRLTADGKNVNPGYWLHDDQYEGSLAFSAKVDGQGFAPGKTPWNYSLTVNKSKLLGEEFDKLSLSGKLSNSRITNETVFRLEESEIRLEASVENYRETPSFQYDLRTDKFDLSEFRSLEAYTSALSLNIKGEGSGSSLETLALRSSIRMDSSVVNGEYINNLTADISIQDTVATVKPAELTSTIADGSFDARMHLVNWYDTQNELNLDVEVKDVQIFAPLADIEDLSAEGMVTGKLSPIYDEALKFTGSINLKDLLYNELFNAREASGMVEVLVTEQPEYVMDLNLVSPVFSTAELQDLGIETRGKIADDKVAGSFSLNFSGPNESGIVHSGLYEFAADSSVITTENYELTSSLRTLVLQRPFDVVLKDQAISMDTMKLASDDGAVLELAIPYADSVRQEGYLVGENLNLAAIQNTMLSESYFEGILSGNLSVANSDTALRASGKLLFSGLSYQGTSLDSLNLELDINSKQFKGNLEAIHEGDQLVSGELNVPFRLGDPQQFSEEFFDKPIDGYLRMNKVTLSRFDTLLSRLGIVDTKGILQFNADLKGTAGNPEFTGNLKLDSAQISGVKVDSLTAGIQYSHESSNLSLNATVNSLKQRAAEIKADIPFFVDLKSGAVSLPGKEDSISVDIETKNFDMAAFNDFVNRDQLRNIKGMVNGMVHVNGTINDLQAKGELNFTEGSVRIVPTGITVDDMRATLFFEPDQLMVRNFRAKSGSGAMNMNGSIAFEELTPGDVDINLRATNFKVANTSEYNAVINLDTKMTGSFTQPNISGSLSVLNGFVQLDNFGEKSVESVQLDPSADTDNTVAIYDSLSLDMDISFNRRFFIRNQRYLELQAELDGSVDMLKDPGEDLQLFGSLETVGGYARPLGKRFELEEGVVTFTGDPGNPDLNIRTLFEPQQPEEEIKIWYTIQGNVEDPQFKYESSPPMELDDILCYTLFGQPCYALESWKRAVASSGSNSSATDLALEVFMDRIESLATQRLGIDVVKIDNTRIGGETGTSITTGWYINPRVFFAIQNVITGSTPDTGFLLEYMLQKNLKLIISQGNDSRQGIDLKWNYDY